MTQSNTKKAIDVKKLVPPKTDNTNTPVKQRKAFSFNPIGNHILDIQTSCNKEEAVAKMLGWLISPLRLNSQEINIHDVALEKMPYLAELYYDLDEYLILLREHAIENLIATNSDPQTDTELKQKAIAGVLDCDDLIINANLYRCALDDELIKESDSRLRIHKIDSELNDRAHITTKSLADWAKEEFQISIFQNIPNISIENLDTNIANSDRNLFKELKPTKSNNLYMCFAILIDAFVKTSTNKSTYLINEKLNKGALAQTISERASQLGLTNTQSKESIKDRIEEAFRTIKKETNKFTL